MLDFDQRLYSEREHLLCGVKSHIRVSSITPLRDPCHLAFHNEDAEPKGLLKQRP